MKKIIRIYLIVLFSLIFTNQLLGNLNFQDNPNTILLVVLIITLFELVLKPIIKILLFPITLITLGLFRSIIDTLGLYLAVFLIDTFRVNNINFPSQTIQGIIIPEIRLDGFWAYLTVSFILSLTFHIFQKLLILKIQK